MERVIRKINKMNEEAVKEMISQLFPLGEETYWGIFYLDHEVALERMDSPDELLQKFMEFKSFLQECRIFNEKRELYLWKFRGGYEYRVREDEVGSDRERIEEFKYKMIGQVKNGILYSKEHGYRRPVPLEDGLYEIRVRNYVEYDEELRQDIVKDARLVTLEKK